MKIRYWLQSKNQRDKQWQDEAWSYSLDVMLDYYLDKIKKVKYLKYRINQERRN